MARALAKYTVRFSSGGLLELLAGLAESGGVSDILAVKKGAMDLHKGSPCPQTLFEAFEVPENLHLRIRHLDGTKQHCEIDSLNNQQAHKKIIFRP